MIGIWVSGDSEIALDSINTFIRSGIRQMKLMPAFFKQKSRWRTSEIIEFARICITNDIEPVLSIWPSFISMSYNRDLFRNIVYPTITHGFSGLEIDIEMNANAKSFTTIDSLHEMLRMIKKDCNIWIGGTTHVMHNECSSRAIIMKHLDRFNVQIYSVAKREMKQIEKDSKYAPGAMQEWGIEKAKKAMQEWKKSMKLSIGLPTWNQKFKGITEPEAMSRAYEACNGLDVCYWNSTHLLGNKYSLEFIRGLTKNHHNR